MWKEYVNSQFGVDFLLKFLGLSSKDRVNGNLSIDEMPPASTRGPSGSSSRNSRSLTKTDDDHSRANSRHSTKTENGEPPIYPDYPYNYQVITRVI